MARFASRAHEALNFRQPTMERRRRLTGLTPSPGRKDRRPPEQYKVAKAAGSIAGGPCPVLPELHGSPVRRHTHTHRVPSPGPGFAESEFCARLRPPVEWSAQSPVRTRMPTRFPRSAQREPGINVLLLRALIPAAQQTAAGNGTVIWPQALSLQPHRRPRACNWKGPLRSSSTTPCLPTWMRKGVRGQAGEGAFQRQLVPVWCWNSWPEQPRTSLEGDRQPARPPQPALHPGADQARHTG